MKTHPSHRLLAVALGSGLVLAALALGCSKPSADTTKPDPSAASTGAGASTATAAAAAAAPAKVDPGADFATIAASCDTTKNLGECSEYGDLGLLGDTVKSLCEGSQGTYSTTARCPKDGRAGICSTDAKKTYYYKKAIDLTGADHVESYCKDVSMGTYVSLGGTAPAGTASSAAAHH
jgi:hypothetical protein